MARPLGCPETAKVDPNKLPDTVVCYSDSTIALPLLTAYSLDHRKPRKPRRLMEKRLENMNALRASYLKRLKSTRVIGKKG